jgi:hypothetical protein
VGRGRRRPGLFGLIALALAWPALAFACSGGGGGSPSEPSPTPTVTATVTPLPTPTPTPTPGGGPSITFTAASTGPGLVLAQGAATTANSLTVELRAAQVTGLYGVAFDLDYPTAALSFTSASAGTFLGSSGQVSMQVAESPPGHLVVGVTRLGQVAGVDGSGVVLQLVFTPVAAGSGPVTVSRNSAFASTGNVINLSWGAGTVTVVR